MVLSIAPTEYWAGNDGPWSTFYVHIGTPAQPMIQVLPASSQSVTAVVIANIGCDEQCPANWPDLRGGTFDPDPSEDLSYRPITPTNAEAYFQMDYDSEQYLPNYHWQDNETANCAVGLDTLALDWSGKSAPKAPGLQSQLVSSYAAPNPWLGMLGLNGRPAHLQANNASSSIPSVLQGLQTNKSISGLYWAYTAGAHYATPTTYGSLTLGGYDAARAVMSSGITVPFGPDSEFDLSLWITNIIISGSSETVVQGMPVYTFIDSVVPEIWLPPAVCADFESAFGLVWNETLEIYLVNDTQHEKMLHDNANVTIFLAANTSTSDMTKITLPYGAFDLAAQYPLAGIQDNTTSLNYFPLKRANDSGQTYLGRTFLQQAYVTADYDRQIFTVSPAVVPAEQGAMTLKTVHPPGHHAGLSTGTIAGIAVGAVAAVALFVGLMFWLWRRRKAQRQRQQQQQQLDTETVRTASIGDTTIVGDTEMAELQHREYYKQPPLSEHYGKPELDAYETAQALVGQQTERHELDAGSVRPGPGHRSGLSWGSSGSGVSGGVSAMSDDRMRNMFSEPSPPPMYPSGSPSPPLTGRRHSRQHSAGSPRGLFEMN
ncbi:hypothetical protein LTR85_006722 [Meristemomyces frigidus]|nr:hypothetical protein LTR85_006722 [Meristemomyces frigidus]